MNKIILLTLLTLFSVIGFSQSKIKLINTDSTRIIVNKHDFFITNINSDFFDFVEIEKDIIESKHQDAKLITRVLSMMSDKEQKMNELLNIGETYSFMEEIILNHLLLKLKKEYGKKELKKLLKHK